MVSSLKFFHSLFIVVLLFGCQEQQVWYKKEIDGSRHKDLCVQLTYGSPYYQGSVPEQFQLDEALEYDTLNAALWREFGTARVKRGIADEMFYYYGKASEINPEKWMGFRGYLYLYFYRDYERAIQDFDDSDDISGYVAYSQGQSHDYMRGVGYYSMDEYEKALFYLNRYINVIVEEDGEDWVDVYAFLYKGLALENLNLPKEAIKEYDRVIKYYPNLSDAFFHRARAKATLHLPGFEEDLQLAEKHLSDGYYHKRPYVEVQEQIYLSDIKKLRRSLAIPNNLNSIQAF